MISRLRRLPLVRAAVRALGVERIFLVLGLASRPVLIVLRMVLAPLHRDVRLVVLGAPLDRFADNAAYLFMYLSHLEGPLQPVWITGSRALAQRLRAQGYDARYRWSGEGMRACLRAATFVYSSYRSDINTWLAPGARSVCLWHGLPIKRVGREVLPAATRAPIIDRLRDYGHEQPPDVLLSSTARVSRSFLAPAFGVRPDQCWELGYPRNDHLVTRRATEPPAALLPDPTRWRQLKARQRVVGLFLTWRPSRADDVADEDLVLRLAAVCGRHGATLAYKAHFNVAATAVTSPHCITLPTDDDLNAYLGLCDVLVTDYSSVALDFLLLSRPTVYFTPDIEQYGRKPGFYLDPRTLPGTLTTDPDALVTTLDDLLTGSPVVDDQVTAAAATIWGADAGHASEQIARRLSAELGLADDAT